jgi:hypothetical protein
MKFFLALTVVMVSWGIAGRAGAGTPQTATPQAVPPVQNSVQNSVQSSASQLGTPAISAEAIAGDRSHYLEQQANEINQTLSDKKPNSAPSVQEMLDLPQGLVIRPTRRGLMVGTDF